MEGWKYYEGKEIFIVLKNKRQYSGKVIEVEQDPQKFFYFITIKDKFGKRVSFYSSEVEIIQEEGK